MSKALQFGKTMYELMVTLTLLSYNNITACLTFISYMSDIFDRLGI